MHWGHHRLCWMIYRLSSDPSVASTVSTPQLFSDPATNPSQSVSKSPFDKTTASPDIVYFLTVPQAYKYADLREHHVTQQSLAKWNLLNDTKVTKCETSVTGFVTILLFFVSSPCLLLIAWDISSTYSIKIGVGHNSRLPGIDIFCVTIRLPLITYSETDFMPPSSLVLSPFIEEYGLNH